MPTPAEQKALAFVALVILLGGAVRIVRGGILDRPSPTLGEQQALARQTYSASSSAVLRSTEPAGKSRRGRKMARESRDSGAERSNTGATRLQLDAHGFPPPSPRIDIGPSLSPAGVGQPPASTRAVGRPTRPIDLDQATETEMVVLPRIGPALAHRIVANRDSAGPFGSLEGLKRVRGVGAATLTLLAPLVTFSGQTRR
ncbi:MAG: helix-hairpin-helix domain-containing protein [Candidatus Dormibacteraeota bacterium]|nr:helix-hairpin-helix domain-containing protein [Candidatus Dormibacteraeota bacterium]